MRRTVLGRRAVLAALVVVPGVACGTNDAEIFGSVDTPQSEQLAAPSTPSAEGFDPAAAIEPVDTIEPADTIAASVADPTTTVPVDSTSSTAGATTTTEAAPAVFPASAELVVSFSYVPDTSGARGVENPYVAVWVEDLDGNLVQTIALWYEQSGKGGKWLSDLPQWYSASGQASDVTMSSATRVAGDYAVAWDGTGLDGQAVETGDYVLFVEAAREHGPYQITSQPITIGSELFTVELADDGELSRVSAALIA